MQGVLALGCELETAYEKLLSKLRNVGHSGNILYKMLHNWPPRFNIFAIPPVTRSTYTKTSIMKKASQTSAYILH